MFDNEFEAGIIDSDGTERTSSSAKNIRTKSYTRVLEGHNYTIINGIKNNLLKGRLYDINKKFIGTSSQITSNTDDLIKTYTAEEGVAFIRFQLDFDDAETGQAVIDGQYPFAIYQDSNDTDYVEHEQTDYILNIQQEMLSGDYFVKEADGWKEVHNYSKEIFDGTEQFTVSSLENTRMVLPIANAKQNPDEILAVSNSFLGVTYNQVQENKLINAICVNNGYLSIDTDGITNVSEFKQTLADKYNAGNPVYFYYKEATPTKLPCTPEQSAVLEELSNLDLFDGVNNIITAENIAKLKLKYVVDTKTYIDKETSDIKEQLNTINELLSTTATSSLLLDNLQSDLESEVM